MISASSAVPVQSVQLCIHRWSHKISRLRLQLLDQKLGKGPAVVRLVVVNLALDQRVGCILNQDS